MLWVPGERCEAGASLACSRNSKKVLGEAEQARGKQWRWAWMGWQMQWGLGQRTDTDPLVSTRVTLTTGLRIDWRQGRAEQKDELRGCDPTGWKPLFPAAFPSERQATWKCVQPALAMSSRRIRFNLCSVRKPKKSRENGAGHEGYSFSGNKKKNKIAICIFDNQGNWLDWSRLKK